MCAGTTGTCLTIVINVTNPTPVSTFIEGPKNNCVDLINGYSYYEIVNLPNNITNLNWTLNGIPQNLLGFSTNNFATVYFTGTSADFNNGESGELCFSFYDACCTFYEICIPIYKCCDCPFGIPSIDCLHADNTFSNTILFNDVYFSPYVSFDINLNCPKVATSKYIVINGTFTVDMDIIFEDCHILMGPEAKFYILSGKRLMFTSPLVSYSYYPDPQETFVHTYCDYMWDGIYFEDEFSQLFINPPPAVGTDNYVNIYDAKNAVVSDYGAQFDIRWAKFQNNNKGIVVNDFAGAHLGTVVFSVFSTLYSPIVTTYQIPMKPYYTSNTTIVNPPLQRPHLGIELNNVSGINIGIGTAPNDHNLFEEMEFGILSNNSNIFSTNNWFNKIKRINACAPPPAFCPAEGCCIYARSFGSPTGALTVGGSGNDANVFTDSDNGIYVEGNHSLIDISYNSFTDIGFTSINPLRNGVYITRSVGSTMNIYTNTFDHFKTGIRVINNPYSTISIYDNILNATNTIIGGMGIVAQEPLLTFGGNPQFYIYNNIIHRTQTGILATNLYGADIGNDNGIILDQNHPSTYASYGIRVQNNFWSKVQYNWVYRCSGLISMSSGSYDATCFPNVNPNLNYLLGNPATASMLTGITLEKSNRTEVFNNYMGYLGAGIRCYDIGMPNYFNCNVMGYNQLGFWLDNSTPGPGNQGTQNPDKPHDNRWNIANGFTPVQDVYGTNSNPNATWYTRTPPPAYPNYPFYPQLRLPPNIIIPTTIASTSNPDCSYTIPTSVGLDAMQAELANIIRTTRTEGIAMTEQQIFFTQLDVYKELLSNDTLMNLNTDDDAYL
ncbi:MAG TPA: hypothetical protein VI757_06320 [Bacteroidia bacterium]|nr:hypothetical protein [Bacteroidia bacterium]